MQFAGRRAQRGVPLGWRALRRGWRDAPNSPIVFVSVRADRARGGDQSAADLYACSLELYRQIPINGGIVRAWIGLPLVENSDPQIPRKLQGEDAGPLSSFKKRATFPAGASAIRLL
jgi:hypothetical protein